MQNNPRILLMNPVEEGQTYVVDVDPVISRHTGGKSKIGTFFPLGLTYIAALLRKNNISSTILDPIPEGHTFASALKYAEAFDIIIIPLAASNMQGVYRFFSHLDNKTRILMGTTATALANSILAEGHCDIVVRGEPEYTVLETIQKTDNLATVAGISYREGTTVIQNPERPRITDLDTLPFPARDLVNNSLYRLVSFLGKPTAMILTSRGCPFSCTYCATHLFYKRKRTVRSPENVIHEIREIVQIYGIKNIFFADDTFTIDEKRVIAICELLQKEKLPIEWLCLGRVDTTTPAMIRAMRNAGCREILYGIESASPEVQRLTKKNITLAQTQATIQATLQAGIRVSAFFMFGNPGDTLQTIRETAALARTLNPTFASFNIATPDPGTELYETLRDRLPANLNTFDRLNTNFSICSVSPHQLRTELIKAYLLFYTRPSFWISLAKFLIRDPYGAPAVLRIFFRQALNVLH